MSGQYGSYNGLTDAAKKKTKADVKLSVGTQELNKQKQKFSGNCNCL